MRHFNKAYEKFRKARIELYAAIVMSFPIGSCVTYSHGDHKRDGMVVDQSDERVCLVSSQGKRLWIYAYRIEEVRGK